MPEVPLFFRNGSYELFGVVHEPPPGPRRTPFVFCHPFGEEKLWSHRVFVTFARQLAQRGHPVLRFDYMGTGDSHGRFAESSVSSAQSDLRSAIGWLKARTGAERVGMLGLRFGATVAATVADARDDVDLLVLWQPIVDGGRYMQELLRINLTTQMTVYREIREDRDALVAGMRAGRTANVDGYEVSLAMFEELSAINLGRERRAYTGACLIVDITRGAQAEAGAEMKRLSGQYAGAALGATREDPFWKEIERFYDEAPNLFSFTLDWLEAPATGAPAGASQTHA